MLSLLFVPNPNGDKRRLIYMNTFKDYPVIAQWGEDAVINKLRELGDPSLLSIDDSLSLEGSTAKGRISEWFQKRKPIWYSNSHVFGFVGEPNPGARLIDIVDVGDHAADDRLKNSRITVTLNHLRVADYPGSGAHRILFDFYAQNNIGSVTEELHFNATYRVMEGERAGVKGYPIFVGLNVGSQGLAFRCYTVNVSNDSDEAFLRRLDSDVFKNGLKLAAVAQPAIAPLSGIAVALTKSIAERNRNVPVQDFFLGLDFKPTPGGGRLAKGSYVVIQVPEQSVVMWNWSEWVFDLSIGQIVNRYNPTELIPNNYIIFGVSGYSE
jgi:hypothetical protein